ncbi:MAG: LysR family transcriptional regulator [Mailhella sp.]|nr:LysR family transcriptional regulator [Mailhella sp.]
MLEDSITRYVHYLRAFYYVAKTGSIPKASETLCLTASAVSQQIQKLESALGIALFERSTGQSLRLLPAGRFIYDRIPALDSALFRFASEARAFQTAPPLRIGALNLMQDFLLQSITAFSKQNPEISFSISENKNDDLCHALIAGELNCVLTFSDLAPNNLLTIPLFSSPLVLTVHESLAGSLSAVPTREELRTLPMIYISANSRTPDLDPYAELDILDAVRIRVDSPAMAVSAAEKKLGAAIVCDIMLRDAAQKGLLTYPLGNGRLKRTFVLALLPHAPTSHELSAFVGFMQSSASPVPS